MAWTNPTPPSAWLAGWIYSAPNITIPLANIPELAADEAHTTTGDIRKVVYAICEKFYSAFNAILTANKPTKMSITKSVSTNTGTGVSTCVYTFTFFTTVTAQDVMGETE